MAAETTANDSDELHLYRAIGEAVSLVQADAGADVPDISPPGGDRSQTPVRPVSARRCGSGPERSGVHWLTTSFLAIKLHALHLELRSSRHLFDPVFLSRRRVPFVAISWSLRFLRSRARVAAGGWLYTNRLGEASRHRG